VIIACYYVKMKYREDIWAFMLANLKFSRTDQEFMSNVWNKYISYKRPVTIRQGQLFDKLISKYSRQLAKLNLTSEQLLQYPWAVEPCEPKLESKIWITEDQLFMTWPYNTAMIETWKHFRNKTQVIMQNPAGYRWDPETLTWSTPSSVAAIKQLLEFREQAQVKHQVTLELDEKLTAINQTLNEFNSKEWLVEARLVDKQIIVNAVNTSLAEHLPESLDISVDTVFKLTKLGVGIYSQILEQLASPVTKLVTSQDLLQEWSDENARVLLEYLTRYDLTAFIVVDQSLKDYAKMIEVIIKNRPADRFYIYSWINRDDDIGNWADSWAEWNQWIPSMQERDKRLATIDYSTVDVLISPRKIFTSIAAEVSKVVPQRLYYMEPKNTPEYWQQL